MFFLRWSQQNVQNSPKHPLFYCWKRVDVKAQNALVKLKNNKKENKQTKTTQKKKTCIFKNA